MIIPCKKITNAKKEELRHFVKAHGGKPVLAILRFDENPVTEQLVENLVADCEQIGVQAEYYRFTVTSLYNEVMSTIYYLDRRASVYGIFVAGDIPDAFKDIVKYIALTKDINNVSNNSKFTDALTKGIMDIINSDFAFSNYNPVGDRTLIIEKGNHCSSLVKALHDLSNSVVWCEGWERDYETWPQMVDTIISATNKANSITPNMIYEGQLVIDLGRSKDMYGQPCGDLDSNCYGKPATFITWQGSDLLFRTALLENLIYETPYGRKGGSVV